MNEMRVILERRIVRRYDGKPRIIIERERHSRDDAVAAIPCVVKRRASERRRYINGRPYFGQRLDEFE